MRNLVLFITALMFVTCLNSQDVVQEMKRVGAKKVKSLDSNGWKKNGLFVLNLNQASLTDWSSGGEKFLIGINGILNYSAHHRYGKYTFDNYFDLELGMVEATSFKKFRKTNDRCDITSEFEHSIGKHTNYGMLANFNSQIFGGHDYTVTGHNKISGFLSPGKLILSPGFDIKSDHKKNNYFSAFLSPVTLRWVFKLEQDFFRVSKFGVDSAKKVNTEVGGYISFHVNTSLTSWAKYIGRLDLFSNYKRNPQNIDLLMNNLLIFSIAKNLGGSILLDIIYDEDIKKRTQVQEIFGLGLKLKL